MSSGLEPDIIPLYQSPIMTLSSRLSLTARTMSFFVAAPTVPFTVGHLPSLCRLSGCCFLATPTKFSITSLYPWFKAHRRPSVFALPSLRLSFPIRVRFSLSTRAIFLHTSGFPVNICFTIELGLFGLCLQIYSTGQIEFHWSDL